jgi:hypothetical protein
MEGASLPPVTQRGTSRKWRSADRPRASNARGTPSRKAKYYAGGDLESEAVGDAAIAVQGQIFAAHIARQTRIRISLYILAAVFVVVSALLVVFVPEGRENLTFAIGAALVVLAAGIAGFSTIRFSVRKGELQAGSHHRR